MYNENLPYHFFYFLTNLHDIFFRLIELDLKYSANPQNLFEAVCISLVNWNVRQATIAAPVAPVVAKATPNPIEVQPVKLDEKPSNANIQQSNINNKPAETFSDNINKLWGSVLLKIKEREDKECQTK